MNGLEPLFKNWTDRQKGIPKGVDETHYSNLKPGPSSKKCLL